MGLFATFDVIRIINLPERVDRRQAMEAQLHKVGLLDTSSRVRFFPAVRCAEKGDWPSLGAKGCFLSHYSILKEALELGARNVLVMEDDLDFSSDLLSGQADLSRTMNSRHWDIVYLGHVEKLGTSLPLRLEPCNGPVRTAHFYAVSGSILPRLIDYLEQLMNRPAGHPDGGPQHFDGALSMFRAQDAEAAVYLASPCLGYQRSSPSDITRRWYDALPVVRQMTKAFRTARRSLRS